MAATAPWTRGRPQTRVTAPARPFSPRQRPITSSLRSIFQSGLSSARTSVKSALARKSAGLALLGLDVGDVAEELELALGPLGPGACRAPRPGRPRRARGTSRARRRPRRRRAAPRARRRPRGTPPPAARRSARAGSPPGSVGDEAGDRSRVRRHQRHSSQVGGGALGRVGVDVHAGGELEGGLDREPRRDVDVPVEVLGAARGGAHPEVELGRPAEALGEQAQRGARSSPRRPCPRRSSAPPCAGRSRSSKGEREAQGQISAASSSIATSRSRRRTSSTRTSLSRLPPAVRSA